MNRFGIMLSISIVIIIYYIYYNRSMRITKIYSYGNRNAMNERSGSGISMFKTAIGYVDINEIEKGIFRPNGYSLIGFFANMIPKIQEIQQSTCDKIMLGDPSEKPHGQLRDNFTFNGYLTMSSCHFNDTFNNDPAFFDQMALVQRWSKENINHEIANVKAKKFSAFVTHYDESIGIYHATNYYNKNIIGKNGAVIGSIIPWVEIMCLANGASKVVTVDYQIIKIGHPDIIFMHAYDLAKARELYYDSFDFVVSFSSIEHSGLGRYGDPIDPIGDIREIKKVHCILKHGGLFFLGIPVGQDDIGYNCHRTYGRLRLPFIFSGFELLNVFYKSEHPIELKLEYFEDTHNYNAHNVTHFIYVLKKL